MSLHILLGFTGPYRTSVPDVLYCGDNGSHAETIRKASPHPRFMVLRDPVGHRRENPNPGVVDIDALRALQGPEEKEAAKQYEADQAAAFQRGGEAAANHFKALIGELPPGAHPDEAKPRAATWLAERANWIAEVQGLRQHIARLEALGKLPLPVDNTAPLALETSSAPEAAPQPAAEPEKPATGSRKK